MKQKRPKIRWSLIFQVIGSIVILITLSLLLFGQLNSSQQNVALANQKGLIEKKLSKTYEELKKTSEELRLLKNEDQYLRNQQLEEQIKSINTTYQAAVLVYEDLLELRAIAKDTAKLETAFPDILVMLSKKDFTSASLKITDLKKQLAQEKEKIASLVKIPANVPVKNEPPGAGFQKQQVATDVGNFLISIVAADLSNTRVLVDTAASGDCANDCPVLSLAEYIAKNGAFAGVNGSYFCPATYPSCSDKKNSFDTLLMNKNKAYFNSNNNVYSTVPAVIFGSGWIRFVSRSLEWGRDTSVDGVIANQPLLVQGGNLAFGGDDDPKKGSKGNRSFVANRGNIIYIGVVHNATVAESARALKTMGMENALNLDDGGSTALWSSGYKVGPGRNIPNAILLVRK